MGKSDLYLRLLGKFHAAQQHFAEQFQAARADADPTAAARLAHSLRGTAGNIGARQVAQAAAALEQACATEQSDDEVQSRLAEVEQCLAPVMEALAGMHEAQSYSAQPPRPPKELQEYLAKLKRLLADSDTSAVEVLRELARNPTLAVPLAPVVQQVELFDFDRALELLQQLFPDG